MIGGANGYRFDGDMLDAAASVCGTTWPRIIANSPNKEAALNDAAAELVRLVRRNMLERSTAVDLICLWTSYHDLSEDVAREAIARAERVAPEMDIGPPQSGDKIPNRLPLTIDDWLARELPEPDFILGHILTTTSRALLVGTTGIGKSLLLIRIGMAGADGQTFLHWQGRRRARVLYIDGEMSKRLLMKRIAEEAERFGSHPAGFHALSHEDIEGFAPLNTPEGQAIIEAVIQRIGGVDLLIFDNVMCLILGDMKDEVPWQQTLPWIRSLTKRNIGQIWGHHTGHDETRSYGTKTREWQMDTVGRLVGVQRPDTDVSFSLEFPKARERTPETRADFQPVRIALVDNQWQYNAVTTPRPGHLPPQALKFLAALHNVLVDARARVRNQPAATTEEWKAECERMGLIDIKGKPASARAAVSKVRAQLVAAHRVHCEGDLTCAI